MSLPVWLWLLGLMYLSWCVDAGHKKPSGSPFELQPAQQLVFDDPALVQQDEMLRVLQHEGARPPDLDPVEQQILAQHDMVDKMHQMVTNRLLLDTVRELHKRNSFINRIKDARRRADHSERLMRVLSQAEQDAGRAQASQAVAGGAEEEPSSTEDFSSGSESDAGASDAPSSAPPVQQSEEKEEVKEEKEEQKEEKEVKEEKEEQKEEEKEEKEEKKGGEAPKNKRILVIGDSHTQGTFGGVLYDKLKEAGHTVVVRGACGEKARDYLDGSNKNCGLREDKDISGANKKPTPKLANLLKLPVWKDKKPDLVVVALGSNGATGSAKLAQRIVDDKMKCLWVGPPHMLGYKNKRDTFPKTMKKIHTELEKDVKPCQLIKSWQLDWLRYKGSDGLHYSGNEGKALMTKWADKVIEKVNEQLGGDGKEGSGKDTGGGAASLSLAVFMKGMTGMKDEAKAKEWLPFMNRALKEGEINTCLRKAAFLAQLAHESGGLKYMEEIASGAAYEGRKDLGNTQPGDGKRFKGRGPIQLTGRANYKAAGKALGLDLVGNPDQVASADVGFRTSVWFWTRAKLNKYADKPDFLRITKIINGGTNGLADRERKYAWWKKELGC